MAGNGGDNAPWPGRAGTNEYLALSIDADELAGFGPIDENHLRCIGDGCETEAAVVAHHEPCVGAGRKRIRTGRIRGEISKI